MIKTKFNKENRGWLLFGFVTCLWGAKELIGGICSKKEARDTNKTNSNGQSLLDTKKERCTIKHGYGENGVDCAGHDYSYYKIKLINIKENIDGAERQLKKENIIESVSSLRTSLEFLLHYLILHRLGKRINMRHQLKLNIKVCEEYELLDSETTKWLLVYQIELERIYIILLKIEK